MRVRAAGVQVTWSSFRNPGPSLTSLHLQPVPVQRSFNMSLASVLAADYLVGTSLIRLLLSPLIRLITMGGSIKNFESNSES